MYKAAPKLRSKIYTEKFKIENRDREYGIRHIKSPKSRAHDVTKTPRRCFQSCIRARKLYKRHDICTRYTHFKFDKLLPEAVLSAVNNN